MKKSSNNQWLLVLLRRPLANCVVSFSCFLYANVIQSFHSQPAHIFAKSNYRNIVSGTPLPPDRVYRETVFMKLDDFPETDNARDIREKSLTLTTSDLLLGTNSMSRGALYSIAMVCCGATLGPFLDHFHSQFGVLNYDTPIFLALWSQNPDRPALITAWWVPELFGLAGFIIGWLTILLDNLWSSNSPAMSSLKQQQLTLQPPSSLKILGGIALFVFQYWLSGFLFASGYDRATILTAMTIVCTLGFIVLDRSEAGFFASLATAFGGPLIEVGLITLLPAVGGNNGYHYTDVGETGFFPLWIVPIYFLGGTVNANLARGIWSSLSTTNTLSTSPTGSDNEKAICNSCNGTRATHCPNCDAQGYYVTYGRRVRCNCCKGKGLIICRSCFNDYGDDPYDIENIRNIMSRMPD